MRAPKVPRVIPALAIDYLGVLFCPDSVQCAAADYYGSLCAGASQVRESEWEGGYTRCERAVLVGGTQVDGGWRNSWAEGRGCCGRYVGVYTVGERVEFITDAAQWRKVLGTIDNLEEASLLAMFQDRPTDLRIDCFHPMGAAHAEGFDVLVYDGTCGSAQDVARMDAPPPGVDAVRVRVRPDGSVTELTREPYLPAVCREDRQIIGGHDPR